MPSEAEEAPGAQTQFVASCTFLFTEVPLLQRPAAARAAGFDAIEFWWPFDTADPDGAAVARFASSVKDAGVQLTGLNIYAGDTEAGERGLASIPGRASEFQAAVDAAVGIGGQLGVEGFTCLYGNRVDGIASEDQDELAAANLAYAARAAATAAARVLLEPVSGAPRYPLRTSADVVGVLDRLESAGIGRVGLLADLYHLAVNQDEPTAAIRRHANRLAHVQIADFPGRHEPGSGELDLPGCLRELAAVGYQGRVALEYIPAAGTESGLAWLPRDLRGASKFTIGS
jgi:hydroxypyruvate isomerase